MPIALERRAARLQVLERESQPETVRRGIIYCAWPSIHGAVMQVRLSSNFFISQNHPIIFYH